MKNRAYKPFVWLGLFILIVGLACGASSGEPTPVPPTPEPPTATAVPPTEVPAPTATPVPPTDTPVPTDVPPTDAPPTDAPPPTEVPLEEPPAYYIEEFDGSSSSYYPDQYLYFVAQGPDEVNEDVYLDDGKLVFEIDTRDTYIYLYYNYWLYEDVRIGLEADNLGANSQSVSLFCRYDPDRGWIEFNIAGDGTYTIYAYDALGGNGYVQLFSGGSTAINIGKKVNVYVAECIGDEIALYANDVEVRTMTIPNAYQFIREGTVGFSVSSFNSVPVLVEVEWFGIEAP
ncbi:MAG: hypothetical protein Fur0022_11420 [Anaerolineales bacterium]